MPKISVQLEAASAEEFHALLAAFHVKPVEAPVDAQILPIMRVEAPQAAEIPQAAEAPVEAPVKPKRGRPFKTAPVEPEATQVQPEPTPVEPAKAEAPVVTPISPAHVRITNTPKPAKAAPPEIVGSRQDLLDAFSEYVQRYGASFGFSDISSLLQKNLGDGVRKASDVPEDKLPVAIGAIKTAIADNPFNRKRDYA